MNPQHNIPTVVDGDFVTNESRAAAAYLVNKHGGEKKNQIYPESPEDRAKVDQRMYFDMGTFYKAFGECVVCTVTILILGYTGIQTDESFIPSNEESSF